MALYTKKISDYFLAHLGHFLFQHLVTLVASHSVHLIFFYPKQRFLSEYVLNETILQRGILKSRAQELAQTEANFINLFRGNCRLPQKWKIKSIWDYAWICTTMLFLSKKILTKCILKFKNVIFLLFQSSKNLLQNGFNF